MLWRVQEEWLKKIPLGTNYDAIIDAIYNLYPNGPVCLVTFNYDTLLESALQARKINIGSTMESYIDPRWRFSVIRLHGSVKWARRIDNFTGPTTSQPSFEGIIEAAGSLELGDYCIVNKAQRKASMLGGQHVFPALAIPLEQKRNFECPKSHLAVLKDRLSKVTKLLIIGWRAADEHFVELLKEGLKPGVRTLVVDANKQEAESIIFTLKHKHELPINPRAFDGGGFSKFVTTRGILQLQALLGF